MLSIIPWRASCVIRADLLACIICIPTHICKTQVLESCSGSRPASQQATLVLHFYYLEKMACDNYNLWQDIEEKITCCDAVMESIDKEKASCCAQHPPPLLSTHILRLSSIRRDVLSVLCRLMQDDLHVKLGPATDRDNARRKSLMPLYKEQARNRCASCRLLGSVSSLTISIAMPLRWHALAFQRVSVAEGSICTGIWV